MQPIQEFVSAHAKIFGTERISNDELTNNINELLGNPQLSVKITSTPNIFVTVGCKVRKVDFGDLVFNLKVYEKSKGVYDFVTCKSKSRAVDFPAPHISYDGITCFGQHKTPLLNALHSHDYALAGQILCNFVGNMTIKSHYYSRAIGYLLETCYDCGDLIKPYIYIKYKRRKKVLSEEKHRCKHCAKRVQEVKDA